MSPTLAKPVRALKTLCMDVGEIRSDIDMRRSIGEEERRNVFRAATLICIWEIKERIGGEASEKHCGSRF